ncbi:MAG: CoB--CoM heterodisulfide reductase iron-sulfur subunit B family protein [Deltaproteobacteria bacterium]|nr:CoB--CoM heterodisulfide reductase iron-sulfur subunit B family protein [Deltaproteobacteria bacterium]
MKYIYYPGCSLEGTAHEYNLSTRALMDDLDVELCEIKEWTCCGASAAEATSRLLSYALPARVMALAEDMEESEEILVPCSACYLNLKKVEQKVKKDPDLLEKINIVLNEDGLLLNNTARPRHLLEVISRDIGAQAIKERVKKALSRISIAPYYGCQCIRPYPVFDDPEEPTSMEAVIRATGAKIHDWEMGGKCCGASIMNTKPEVAMVLIEAILQAAKGADAIVTVCPMCQMNLEAYQDSISRQAKEDLHITVLYLPQLLGYSLGLPEKDLGIGLNLSVKNGFKRKIQ